MITIGSTADNTVVTLSGGGSGDRAQGRLLSVTNPGTSLPDAINAMVTANTRFSANVAADRGSSSGGNTAVAQDAVDYSIVFSVVPDYAVSTYNIDINTSILGAASARDDHSGLGGGGVASMTAVTGRLNAVLQPSLGLASAATRNGTSNTSGQDTAFSGSNVLSIGPFVGPQNFTLRFQWTMRAESPQNLIGGDEQAVRLGFNDPLPGANPDNYPGNPSRVQANDGHFVGVKVTVLSIPEPSTFVLAGLGVCGLAFASRRRKA